MNNIVINENNLLLTSNVTNIYINPLVSNINIYNNLSVSSNLTTSYNSGNINICSNYIVSTNFFPSNISTNNIVITGNINLPNIKFSDNNVQYTGFRSISNNTTTTTPALLTINNKGQVINSINKNKLQSGTYINSTVNVDGNKTISLLSNGIGITLPKLTQGGYTATSITVNSNGVINLISNGLPPVINNNQKLPFIWNKTLLNGKGTFPSTDSNGGTSTMLFYVPYKSNITFYFSISYYTNAIRSKEISSLTILDSSNNILYTWSVSLKFGLTYTHFPMPTLINNAILDKGSYNIKMNWSGSYDYNDFTILSLFGYATDPSSIVIIQDTNILGVSQNKYNAAYSLKLINSSYTGPIVNIRRSSDNVVMDFYGVSNIVLLRNSSGIELSTWLSGSVGYVTTWYDQSSNNKHATQTTASSQPKINLTNDYIDFRWNTFLRMPSGTIPSDGLNLPYTFYAKYNTIDSVYGGIVSAGRGANNYANVLRFNTSNGKLWNYWWNNDFGYNSPISITPPATTCVTYSGATSYGYINNLLCGSSNRSGYYVYATDPQNIGLSVANEYLNGGLHYVLIFNTDISDIDRYNIEIYG